MVRDFRHTTIEILRETPFPGSENYVTRFQIIKWGNGDPVLEKRVYRQVEGEWQPLKIKGWTSEDIQLPKSRLDDVLALMDEA